jgi:hypothetical protein
MVVRCCSTSSKAVVLVPALHLEYALAVGATPAAAEQSLLLLLYGLSDCVKQRCGIMQHLQDKVEVVCKCCLPTDLINQVGYSLLSG